MDGLLAELRPTETEVLDVALDLRHALAARRDAAGCVQLALKLRHRLDGTHYLAFYRVRQWLQRVIAVQVRSWRGSPWSTFPLPLNSARFDEIENAGRAAWAADHRGVCSELAQVRFVFRTGEPSPVGPFGASPARQVAAAVLD